jgi:hypothetical protein
MFVKTLKDRPRFLPLFTPWLYPQTHRYYRPAIEIFLPGFHRIIKNPLISFVKKDKRINVKSFRESHRSGFLDLQNQN